MAGTFVADNSGAASFTLEGNISTQANAFQYRDLGTVPAVPEASSSLGLGLMLGLGAFGLVVTARKRRRSAQA